MSHRTALLLTGGTIGQVSGADGLSRPGFEVGSLVGQLGSEHRVEARTVMERASKDMEPRDWVTIAIAVQEAVASGCDGVLVVHGTDTLHYTAAALSYLLDGLGVPVVLTGSMTPGGDPGGDAKGNLHAALAVATSNVGEVCAVFGAQDGAGHSIMRGINVRKVHSTRPAAFASVGCPDLGVVTPGGEVRLTDRARPRAGGVPGLHPEIEREVAFVQVTPTLTSGQLAALVERARGVVVQGTGVGHVPARLMSTLRAVAESGRPIVISTQTDDGGEALGTYAGDAELLALPGLVQAGSLPAETALVALMCELGRELPPGTLIRR